MKQKIITREKAKQMQPVIWIGKKGITPELIEEIKKQVKDKKLIKIKLLKSALNDKSVKEMAEEICEQTSSTLIDKVGHVIVIEKDVNRNK
jgi:RNA-binding protein